MNNIEIFQAENGAIELRGDSSLETLWANLEQISKLFSRDKSGISRHIKNIYESEELQKEATVAIFATVQIEGKREVTRDIEHYNLDMILSIGYRVDSKEATQFRKWASSILKQYLVNSYAINEKKLTRTKELLNNLKVTIDFLSTKEIGQEKEIFSLLKTYTKTLSFIIKDHPFNDGNKRSASFLFIYFLDKCDYLYKSNGEKKINENALTTLTLLVASSNPNEKDILVKLIKHLIFEEEL
ncbi:MAG: virulence protein RhuM/Fic/DOC family protein [Sulfurimonas sp.]